MSTRSVCSGTPWRSSSVRARAGARRIVPEAGRQCLVRPVAGQRERCQRGFHGATSTAALALAEARAHTSPSTRVPGGSEAAPALLSCRLCSITCVCRAVVLVVGAPGLEAAFFIREPAALPFTLSAAWPAPESRPRPEPSTVAPPGTGSLDHPAHVGLRDDLQPHRASRRRATSAFSFCSTTLTLRLIA